MGSRETTVHVIIVLFAIFGTSFLSDIVGLRSNVAGVVFLLQVILISGGSHLYFALRGADGSVPVSARWRFIGLLAILGSAGGGALAFGDRTVATIELSTLALGVGILAVISYFVIENISAYRASRPD